MSLALGSESLLGDTENISKAIDHVYDEVKDYSKCYDKFVQMYDRNVSMDLNDFREKDHEFLNGYIHGLFE